MDRNRAKMRSLVRSESMADSACLSLAGSGLAVQPAIQVPARLRHRPLSWTNILSKETPMNGLSRRVYRLQTDNNARAHFLWVLWFATLVLRWITCPSGWDEAGGLNIVLKNHHLWRASELCDWCTPYILRDTFCQTLSSAVMYGLVIAVGYWVIAHLDDVARGVEHLLKKAVASRRTSTSATSSDTESPAQTPASHITREIFVEFVAEALWDLLRRRHRP